MNNLAEINGIFSVHLQRRREKVTWIILLFMGLGILAGFAYLAFIDPFTKISNSSLTLNSGGLYMLIFFCLTAVVLVYRGIKQIFKKNTIYFEGIRITDTGFESGKLIPEQGAIGPTRAWEKSLNGKITSGIWEPQQQITNQNITVIISLREARERKKCYFIERIAIASQDTVLYQLIGAHAHNEHNFGSLVEIKSGGFNCLGGITPVPCNTYLPTLERIANLLSKIKPEIAHACTINLMAKNADFALALPFGLLGTLVAAGKEVINRAVLMDSFTKGNLFDPEFSQKLIDFTEKNGWSIAINGKPLSEK